MSVHPDLTPETAALSAPFIHPRALGLPKHPGSRFVTARPHGLVITRVLTASGESDVKDLPREGREPVFCPLCGREGGYAKGHGRERSPLDHFEHSDDVRAPDHADHRFRTKPITHSGPSRSPIPGEADHPFRPDRSPRNMAVAAG